MRITDFGMHHLGDSRAGSYAGWNGAVGYLPPEVYRGDAPAATARGDIFALGALLFECLTGQRLFDAPNAAGVMFKICLAPLPVLGPLLPQGYGRLEGVVAMACAKDPEARFEDPAAFWQAIRAVLGVQEVVGAPAPKERAALPVFAPAQVLPAAPAAPPALSVAALSAASAEETSAPAQRSTLENWLVSDEGGGSLPIDGRSAEPSLGMSGFELPIDTTGANAGFDSPRSVQAAWAAIVHDASATARASYRRLGLAAALGATAMSAVLFVLAGLTGHLRVPPPAAVTPAQPAPSPAPVAIAPPRTPSAEDDAAILKTVREHLAARDYTAALSAAETLVRRHPDNSEAQRLLEESTADLRLYSVYQGFERAVKAGDVDTAAALYGELPAGSPFQIQAEPAFAGLRGPLLAAHLSFAAAASKSGLCDEVDWQAEALRRLGASEDQSLGEARRLAEQCHAHPQPEQKEPGAPHRRRSPVRDGLDGLRNPFAAMRRGRRPDPLPILKDPFGSGKLPLKSKENPSRE